MTAVILTGVSNSAHDRNAMSNIDGRIAGA
jgi:hypothetical protein